MPSSMVGASHRLPCAARPRGRAAPLAALASRAPLKPSAPSQKYEARFARRPRGCAARRRRQRPGRPATRAAPGPGAPTQARRSARSPRARHAGPPPTAALAASAVLGPKTGFCSRAPRRYRQRCGPGAAGTPCAQPRSAAAPAARAARIVHHSRGDCPSGARGSERSEFRRASRCGEHRRAPPRSGGKHPARPRRAARAFACEAPLAKHRSRGRQVCHRCRADR